MIIEKSSKKENKKSGRTTPSLIFSMFFFFWVPTYHKNAMLSKGYLNIYFDINVPIQGLQLQH
ncbi:hypothetical protein [Rummeliibacillus stabekisii]|uniref:Uncharacterized protein n=1 Tax=Rummeliibacillus stabekisii TaxID=241244 RepID=A0A143HF51_9BACL|nr:hypothetical protein [Rummeliibacillus stabekisii]AMX00354.1 hypothetical protein ATY39_13600 [Rummeliibacillus stabekisii]